MNLEELEQELRRARGGSAPPSGAPRLSTEQALEFRNSGNLPDASGRSLRLVLHVSEPPQPGALEKRRLEFEPDYHEDPVWRTEASRPVHIVPLRATRRRSSESPAWYEEPHVAELEAEWQRTGAISGVNIPGDLRGFLYKTILALRSAGKAVSVQTLSASVARWLQPDDAARISDALRRANPEAGSENSPHERA